MPRPLRPVVIVAGALLLAGCTGGGTAGTNAPPTPTTASSPELAQDVDPFLSGLDVCRLVPPPMAMRASGQPVDPTSRTLTALPGYQGVVDECGFGVSFDSAALSLAVGLAPATAKDLRRLGGRAQADVGQAARTKVTSSEESVSFLRGTTLVQLRAPVGADGPSRIDRLVTLARDLVRQVPAAPPESDDQTTGRCKELSADRVDAVLGTPAALSRSFSYADGSVVCSWATGTTRARTVAVSLYTNSQAGPFLASQKATGPSADVPGVPGDAFTTPSTAYVVAADGQVIGVTGRLEAAPPKGRALPVTPELTALLKDATSVLQ